MDDQELHYLTYDEDAMWEEMVSAYIGAGGDVLYPGDEKEILLRGAEQIIMQAFAGIDNALRMDTLRYAVRDYLDIYGEKRNCYRLKARAAGTTVSIVTNATGEAATLPAGTAMTQDGTLFWTLDDDLTLTGLAETVTAAITASTEGEAGNVLQAGMTMDMAVPNEHIYSITVLTDATGGQNEEDDETYRDRIRTYGLSTVTTGPSDQYERAARSASSQVVDAAAVNGGAGQVNVFILPASNEGTSALIEAVEAALSPTNVRPLDDLVTVALATKLSYTLNVEYTAESGQNISAALAEAVSEYQTWQDRKIGRPFNPDRLKAALYSAGCSLVRFGSGSTFDGGTAEYTEIDEDEYCGGTVTLAVISG